MARYRAQLSRLEGVAERIGGVFTKGVFATAVAASALFAATGDLHAQNRPGLAWGLSGIDIVVAPDAPLSLNNPTGNNQEALPTRVSGVVRSGLRQATRSYFIGSRATRLVATVQSFQGISSETSVLTGGRMTGELDLELRDALTGEVLARETGLTFSRRVSSGLFGVGSSQRDEYIEEIALATRGWMRNLGCADAACTVAGDVAPARVRVAAIAPEPEAPAPRPVIVEEPEPVLQVEPEPEPEPEVVEAITPDPVEPEVSEVALAAPEDAEEEGGGFFSRLASVFDSDHGDEVPTETAVLAEDTPAVLETGAEESAAVGASEETEVAALTLDTQEEAAPARTERNPRQTVRRAVRPAATPGLAANLLSPVPVPRDTASGETVELAAVTPEVAVTPDPVVEPEAEPETVAEPEPEVIEEPDIAALTPVEPVASAPEQEAPALDVAPETSVTQPDEPEPVVALADPVSPLPRPRIDVEPEPDPNEIAAAPSLPDAGEQETETAALTAPDAGLAVPRVGEVPTPNAPDLPDLRVAVLMGLVAGQRGCAERAFLG
ncbi:MAG: hypothetical protein AAFR17_05440, partial [Pseudomonadota bacterium]